MAEITIGGTTYPSKKVVQERVRSIANNATLRTPLEGDDFLFLLDLFRRHEDADRKFGGGICRVWVEIDNYGGRGFILQRFDGSQTDISWTKCLSPPKKITKVRSALRTFVRDQVVLVKRAHFCDKDVAACQLTGQPITWDTSHVDHHPILFSDLVEDFLSWKQVAAEDIELVTRDGVQGSILADSWVRLGHEFSWYHEQYARLRVLHQSVHLRLPDKGRPRGA